MIQNKSNMFCASTRTGDARARREYALFKDGKPTQFTQSAMNFCATLRQQGEVTDEFVKALKDYNLLMNNDAQLICPTARSFSLQAFKLSTPRSSTLLPDAVYLSWRRKGWIGLIFAHPFPLTAGRA